MHCLFFKTVTLLTLLDCLLKGRPNFSVADRAYGRLDDKLKLQPKQQDQMFL